MEAILAVRNLNKSFTGVQALKNIDVLIKPGEIHCVYRVYMFRTQERLS